MNFRSQSFPQILLFGAGMVFGGLIALFTWGMLRQDDPASSLFWFELPHQDKILHFVAFGMMAVPAGLVLPRRYLGFIFMCMTALAAGMEIAQEASNMGRTGSVYDFIASTLGALVACAGLLFLRRMLSRKFDTNTDNIAEA